jgi:hypothetical protein
LDAANGDEMGVSSCEGFRDQILELSGLVASKCETGVYVFSLGVEFYFAS